MDPKSEGLRPLAGDSRREATDPATAYLQQLTSSESRRTMLSVIHNLVELLGGDRGAWQRYAWWLLEYPRVLWLRRCLMDTYSPSSVNKHLAALRGVLKEAWRLSLMSTEAYMRAIDVRGVRVGKNPTGRALSLSELEDLLSCCQRDRDPLGARDAGLIAVMGYAGLRRAEAAQLDRGDYDSSTGELVVRHGKGDKARLTYLGSRGRDIIDSWLVLRGDAPGPLFFKIGQDRRVRAGERTDPKQFGRFVARRAKRAGVRDLTPHDLRRTFITRGLETSDVLTIQELVGHASADTTARYDRRGEERKKRAVEAIERG